MTPLYATILATSLAGSVHCLAMCGPLVTLSAGRASLRLALVHALGRLATYATLGALAGLVGRAVDLAGRLAAVHHAATAIAALIIVGWGVHTIAVARGWIAPRAPRSTAFTHGLARLRTQRPTLRAWLAGALTGLVPCGWLWAFVVSAAGTGSVLAGAAVMSVFWLGTVPAMTGLLALAGPVLARLRQRMPVITAIALIVLGLGTLAARYGDAGAAVVEQPHCHGGM